MWGRLHIKTTQIPPFFCYIPVFQSFLSLYIPLSFANFSHLRKNSQKCGSSLYSYLYLLFFFLIFVCIKSHPSSDSGKISWKESKFKTMKRPNASDDEECGHKKLREQAVCELSSSQESSSTQSVKEILRPGIEQKRVQQNEESYSRSQVMLLFRIGLRSCQILVIFVKCGR